MTEKFIPNNYDSSEDDPVYREAMARLLDLSEEDADRPSIWIYPNTWLGNKAIDLLMAKDRDDALRIIEELGFSGVFIENTEEGTVLLVCKEAVDINHINEFLTNKNARSEIVENSEYDYPTLKFTGNTDELLSLMGNLNDHNFTEEKST